LDIEAPPQDITQHTLACRTNLHCRQLARKRHRRRGVRRPRRPVRGLARVELRLERGGVVLREHHGAR
jgi:hypothetical protein